MSTYNFQSQQPKKQVASYFSMPSADNFLSKEELLQDPNKSRKYKTLNDHFGPLAKMSEEQVGEFLLMIIKHAEFKPDFVAAAKDLGMGNSSHVSRRFKTIVERAGFEWRGDRIIDPDDEGKQDKEDVAGGSAKKKSKVEVPVCNVCKQEIDAEGRPKKLIKRNTLGLNPPLNGTSEFEFDDAEWDY